MTRNNLNIHISWLLQNKVSPVLGTFVTARTSYHNKDEDGYEELGEVEMERDNIEPPPSSPYAPRARVEEMHDLTSDTITAKSAHSKYNKANRDSVPKSLPKVLPGHADGFKEGQLATPASTRPSKNPAAPTRTLLEGYSEQLRAKGLCCSDNAF